MNLGIRIQINLKTSGVMKATIQDAIKIHKVTFINVINKTCRIQQINTIKKD